jgi:hypothetical protein
LQSRDRCARKKPNGGTTVMETREWHVRGVTAHQRVHVVAERQLAYVEVSGGECASECLFGT